MTQSKMVLGFWVLALAFTFPQAAYAVDAFEDTSSVTTTGADTLPSESWQPQESPGKTMEEFVTEAKAGFPDKFTDGEVLTVMSAARKVYDTDRDLSRKLERIASKMSAL